MPNMETPGALRTLNRAKRDLFPHILYSCHSSMDDLPSYVSRVSLHINLNLLFLSKLCVAVEVLSM